MNESRPIWKGKGKNGPFYPTNKHPFCSRSHTKLLHPQCKESGVSAFRSRHGRSTLKEFCFWKHKGFDFFQIASNHFSIKAKILHLFSRFQNGITLGYWKYFFQNIYQILNLNLNPNRRGGQNRWHFLHTIKEEAAKFFCTKKQHKIL